MLKFLTSVVAFVADVLHAALLKHMSRHGLVLYGVYIPDGSVVHIASSYGDATSMTAVTNADPAVATLESSHAISTGNVMEVSSGWGRLNERIIRAGTVAGNNIPLEGFNSTDTVRMSSGGGVGSIREILEWTQLTQILEFTGEGGEQQFLPYQFMEELDERRIPTKRSASGTNIVVADDDSLAGFILCQEADDDREPRAIRVTKTNGGLIYFSAIITLAPMPVLEIGQLGRARISFSLQNPIPTKYAS